MKIRNLSYIVVNLLYIVGKDDCNFFFLDFVYLLHIFLMTLLYVFKSLEIYSYDFHLLISFIIPFVLKEFILPSHLMKFSYL